jgi:hypothetical protein
VLASIEPHADVGKPRLWSIGAQDRAVAGLSWPPVFADALPADAVPADPEPAQRGSVVPLRGGRT